MDNEWKKYLVREASSHRMCLENRRALEVADSKEAVIKLYKKTVDWALEENYPDIGALRKYFSDCQEFGVFIDREFHGEILNNQQVYVFHNCSGTIRTGLNLDLKIIPMLYFANGCDITVKASDERGLSTRVPLYVFGDNRVMAETSDNVVCRIYNFDVK